MLTSKATIIGMNIVVVCVFFFLFGCSNSSIKQAIESVLEQDNVICQGAGSCLKSMNFEDTNDLKEIKRRSNEIQISLNILCHGQENINLNGCPEDFVKAYKEHCIAWKNYYNLIGECIQYLEKRGGFWNQLRDTFKNGADKNLSDIASETARIEFQEKERVRAIQNTYNTTLEIASKYGVDITKYKRN